MSTPEPLTFSDSIEAGFAEITRPDIREAGLNVLQQAADNLTTQTTPQDVLAIDAQVRGMLYTMCSVDDLNGMYNLDRLDRALLDLSRRRIRELSFDQTA